MTAVIESVKCNSCRRIIPMSEVKALGLGNRRDGIRCPTCKAAFMTANLAASQNMSQAFQDSWPGDFQCSECQRTLDQVFADDNSHSMFFVEKDGIVQPLCARCNAAYSAKATELYRGTMYENVQKLRGNK